MRLPSREQCLEWYKELDTHPQVMRHVLKVNELAVFLAEKLKEKGVEINVELVDRASLLHDLDKWLCINDKTLVHGLESEKILTAKGYPKLAYHARQHVLEFLVEGYDSWEEKVICYADTRVLNDKIVALDKRLNYIFKRYADKYGPLKNKIIKAAKQVEKEIFEILEIEPDSISI